MKIMNKLRLLLILGGVITLGAVSQSCLDENNEDVLLTRPTALVTVRPQQDGKVTLQLDDKTTLYPSNMETSRYGKKEVRALVNYRDEPTQGDTRYVHVYWLDSIRTKVPVPDLGVDNDRKYGKDAIEIVRDWVTVAEDGYLTLRIRTLWGYPGAVHYVNLLRGVNPENPYEFELRHDARGDVYGTFGDALIAFNLNDLPVQSRETIKIKLRWKSFSGMKSTEFDLCMREKNTEFFREIPSDFCRVE